jgi:hypothetical protein
MSLNRLSHALLRAVPVILVGLGTFSAHAASSSEPIKSGRARLWAEEVEEAIRDRPPRRNGTVQEGSSGIGAATRSRGSGPADNRDATGSTGGNPAGRGSSASGGDSPGRGGDAGGGHQSTPDGHQGNGRGGDQGGRGGDGRGGPAER